MTITELEGKRGRINEYYIRAGGDQSLLGSEGIISRYSVFNEGLAILQLESGFKLVSSIDESAYFDLIDDKPVELKTYGDLLRHDGCQIEFKVNADPTIHKGVIKIDPHINYIHIRSNTCSGRNLVSDLQYVFSWDHYYTGMPLSSNIYMLEGYDFIYLITNKKGGWSKDIISNSITRIIKSNFKRDEVNDSYKLLDDLELDGQEILVFIADINNQFKIDFKEDPSLITVGDCVNSIYETLNK